MYEILTMDFPINRRLQVRYLNNREANPLMAYLSTYLIKLSIPTHSEYVSNTNALVIVVTAGITCNARHCLVGANGDLFEQVSISFFSVRIQHWLCVLYFEMLWCSIISYL